MKTFMQSLILFQGMAQTIYIYLPTFKWLIITHW